MKITTRNATYQQWQALLTNRTKRQRSGQFLIQGVRPITLAVDHGVPLEYVAYRSSGSLSSWALSVLDRSGATPVAMDPSLVDELAERESSELVAVASLSAPSLSDIPDDPGLLAVVFDRPSTPGNVGTLIRSADAFGATAVIVTGHAADPYDPRSVRASTGSLFALPVIRADSHREVLEWVASSGTHVQVVGTDEHGAVDVASYDMTGPRLLVIGNETHGLSAGWREAVDTMVRIPITGAASSLNAAAAATVVLYEAARQRSRPASA
jgi:23S rRNA (uridine2479-2'-O)-methyltransferase